MFVAERLKNELRSHISHYFGCSKIDNIVCYGHVCVLEQKAGEGMGGRAQCWGHDHKEDALDSPKDVTQL